MRSTPTCSPTQTPDDIDLPGLRKRYKQERDKRVRPEGHNQYVEVVGELAGQYETDPYSAPVKRAPIAEEIDVAVVGGGFAGLLAGARLKEASVSNLRIIEVGGDFGGTWYWNRYPGIQCDIESYSYLPLLEELNYIPRHRYSFGPEIYEYCQRIGKHFELYKSALFSTIVRSLRWDESKKRWRIATNRGDDIRARFVIIAVGYLNRPKLPGIPGRSEFNGHSFHTSRWDYEYTGGDSDGGLVKLRDKRVAIIGTGATALQCVPYLGQSAKHLYVFQRTPSSVDERLNRPTDPEWARSLQPGWQAARIRNSYAGTSGAFAPGEDDLVCDGWTEISRNVHAKLVALGHPELPPEKIVELREIEDYRVMERLRRRVESIVKDRETAEKLKAWYRFQCKRPGFSDTYLQTFNRPNVTLVDVSDSKGVERITEKGLVGNGIEYEVDCIIYASGFEFTADTRRRYGIDTIAGRGGLSLYENWSNGFRTLHGMTSRGFPNLCFTGFTQSALANSTAMYDQQGGHIAYIISEALARRAATVEPSQEAQDAWAETIRKSAVLNEQYLRECTPGYFNSEGAEVIRSPLGEFYGPGFYDFERLLKEWRDKGEFEGLVLGT